jgi:hypothetical protein
MSDRDVIEHIYSHLMCASEMLGENREAAGVEALGHEAARLLAAVDADVAPDRIVAEKAVTDDAGPSDVAPSDVAPSDVEPGDVAPGRDDRVVADTGSGSSHAPPARGPLQAVGRGPPF